MLILRHYTQLLLIAFLTLSCSRRAIAESDKSIKVTLKLERDTISLDSANYAKFSIEIENITHSTFNLKKDYLVCGYPNDENYSDYYIEMYKVSKKTKTRVQDFTEHYPIVEYYGDYVKIPTGGRVSYQDVSFLNKFKSKGDYIFRAVFYNKNSFIGKSNWVTITVL